MIKYGIFTYVFFLILFTSSCEFQEPELINMEGMKVTQFSKDKIVFAIQAKVRNPNNFKLCLVNTDLDININGISMGKAELLKRVSLKKKSTDSYTIELYNVPKNFAQLGLTTLFSTFTSGKLTVNVKGTVKGRARMISKKFDVDFNHNVNMPKFNGTN